MIPLLDLFYSVFLVLVNLFIDLIKLSLHSFLLALKHFVSGLLFIVK